MILARSVLASLICLILLASAGAQGHKPSKTADEERKVLAKLDASYKSSKQSYLKKPKDAKLKAEFVKSALALGDVYMYSPHQDRRTKYKQALGYYREAKNADPKNQHAIKSIETIEAIYKSLGRPIPK